MPPPPRLAPDATLFLDFDGTLVEIAARPDAVQVERRLHHLLKRLQARLGDRLAIVSGRAAADIRALFPEASLVVAGSHGAELAGGESIPVLPAPDTGIEDLLRDLQRRQPRILIERKPLGIALHYRQAPEARLDCLHTAAALAERTGLTLQPGKMVIELRDGRHDKGTAVRALMDQAPLCEGRPVFVGDDETDEPGFRAATALGGTGILVGPARPTAAQYRLAGVEDTLRWLDDGAAA